MKRIDIDVCVCTECVMNGAMNIIESIDGLKEMLEEGTDEYDSDIELAVNPVKCLGESKHGIKSPIVSIDGSMHENVSNETVMAAIMDIIKKDRS